MSASVTEEVAEVATKTQLPKLGSPGRERLIACLIDHVACLAAGRRCPHVTPSRSLALRGRAGDNATADGLRPASLFAVAYHQGQSANGWDWDDTLLGHPGSAIISAAMAAAEDANGTLADVGRAVTAGYDAHYALSTAGYPSQERLALVRGFTGWETIAAAIAAAVARRSSGEVIQAAIGIACTHAPVPYLAKWYDRPVPTVKNNLGWSAAVGVMAVLLAEDGARGITDALGGDTGFWRMAGSDIWRWGEPPRPSGLERVGFKQFPACWHVQESLATVSRLLAEVDADVVSEVDVEYTVPSGLERFMDFHPKGTVDIAFSLPRLTEILLLRGALDVETITASFIGSTTGWAQQHVRYKTDSQASIEITVPNGEVFSSNVNTRDYFNPASFGISPSEVVEKFERITRIDASSHPLLSALNDANWDRPLMTVPFGLGDANPVPVP